MTVTWPRARVTHQRMHTLIQIVGLACVAYFSTELLRLARQTRIARRFLATDPHTGRRLTLRPDRRLRERRGTRDRFRTSYTRQ